MRQIPHRRIALETLGCKANWTDTESLLQALCDAGCRIVPFDQEADAYVVNTCAVTATAVRQSRQMLRRAVRRDGAIVIAAGCYGELGAEALRAATGVDAVFGPREREALIAYLLARLNDADPPEMRVAPAPFSPQPLKAQSRARAFLKIQEGCSRACAYCIIPTVRGPAVSMAPEAVIAACRELARHHHEIILTGIDIGQYGDDLGGTTDIVSLLQRLERERVGARLRISSLDPIHIDDRLIELLSGSGCFCRHIHLSLQSGSRTILRRMGRRATPGMIARAVERLVDAVPGIAVTGDCIAGFPGEGEREHAETKDLIASLPMAGLHVFPYSPRPGTRAAAMDGVVAERERKCRAAELRDVAQEKRGRFLAALVGERLEVIVTGCDEEGVNGFSDNAVVVRLPRGTIRSAECGMARVQAVGGEGVTGIWERNEMTNSSSRVSKNCSATGSNAAII